MNCHYEQRSVRARTIPEMNWISQRGNFILWLSFITLPLMFSTPETSFLYAKKVSRGLLTSQTQSMCKRARGKFLRSYLDLKWILHTPIEINRTFLWAGMYRTALCAYGVPKGHCKIPLHTNVCVSIYKIWEYAMCIDTPSDRFVGTYLYIPQAIGVTVYPLYMWVLLFLKMV